MQAKKYLTGRTTLAWDRRRQTKGTFLSVFACLIRIHNKFHNLSFVAGGRCRSVHDVFRDVRDLPVHNAHRGTFVVIAIKQDRVNNIQRRIPRGRHENGCTLARELGNTISRGADESNVGNFRNYLGVTLTNHGIKNSIHVRSNQNHDLYIAHESWCWVTLKVENIS